MECLWSFRESLGCSGMFWGVPDELIMVKTITANLDADRICRVHDRLLRAVLSPDIAQWYVSEVGRPLREVMRQFRAGILVNIDRNIVAPSSPPINDSHARSGCGIMPRTLPAAFMIPAMLFTEPFGLNSEVTSPPGPASRNTTRPVCPSSSSVSPSAPRRPART